MAPWLLRTTKPVCSQGLSLVGALGLVVASVAACVADPVIVQAPDEQGLRPRRLFVLLAVGPDVVPRNGAVTTRAWRALGDELQVRGFDLIALAAPRTRPRQTEMDTLATEVERALQGVDVASYDELVLVSSPEGACVWSMLIDAGALPGSVQAHVSLHVELRPSWDRVVDPGHVGDSTPRCGVEDDTNPSTARLLKVRLLGRSSGARVSDTGSRARDGGANAVLDVPLDARAFGRDLVLLIDELFETRDGDRLPKPDLRRVTR